MGVLLVVGERGGVVVVMGVMVFYGVIFCGIIRFGIGVV